MITLHCQHRDDTDNHKCGRVVLSIQNGCIMLVSYHDGEKHVTVLTLADMIRLQEEDKRRREPVLQVQ